jgi:lysophospholipase L1-like esterase
VWAALVVVALLAMAGSGLTAASATSPPVATAQRPLVYDALGDSYASGYGVPPYSACGRSAEAYAVQLARLAEVRLDQLVACAGATTSTLRSRGQLRALDGRVGLVTLTIGGNDAGWASAVASCLGGTDIQCSQALEQSTARVRSALPRALDRLYTQIAARAPRAHVLVVGYPRLFSPDRGSALLASPAEQRALNRGADLLDEVIARAAAAHGFTFVDVRKRFEGHGANAADPWILGPFDAAPFHPNAAGYRAYAAAVAVAVRGVLAS